MVNLTHPELAEISAERLPLPSDEVLLSLRARACESSQSGFQLQSQQRFLRGVLSPDSPTRSLLMVHGTGTGKTCTAIQIAEEYILRPEFQDRKVLVLASAAVQENFADELFDISRVNIDVAAGTLESQQCTGRRYLDMLLRIEQDPKNWMNPDRRDQLTRTADRIIREFYEFGAYVSFGKMINKYQTELKKPEFEEWIHKTFDNRLIIVDEAHNIRQARDDGEGKEVTAAMETLIKIADGVVLVLLTATPMYHSYDEIVYYFNLFRWNERRQPVTDAFRASDFFNEDGTLKEGPSGEQFRTMCQEYVSYVRGDNPFTFPFRLPPPPAVEPDALTRGFLGDTLGPTDKIKYLQDFLVYSTATGLQKSVLSGEDRSDEEEKRRVYMQSTVSVLPGSKSFRTIFAETGSQYTYTVDPFLTPDELPKHSAKFASVLKSIEAGEGICFVYSNFATMGALLFSMALEEHGYTPAKGQPLLSNPAYSGSSKGQYVLLTSKASESEIADLIQKVKDPRNQEGKAIRVIVSSPIVSEGVDFRYVRQIHVLDPWWNMSRTEQVIGRGLRTCSHARLTPDKQNCTVYLHVVRTGDGNECYDEYTYRSRVVPNAMRIANVRRVLEESAMDCPMQNQINSLPEDWKNFPVTQRRSEGNQAVTYKLKDMMAPSFMESPDVKECIVKPSEPDPEHVRPLSTYLDVRDELLQKVSKMLIDKPIWDRTHLLKALKPYTDDVIVYNLQHAISSSYRFKDAFGRPALLESKGDLYALAPIGIQNGTMIERTSKPIVRGRVDLPKEEAAKAVEVEVAPDLLAIKRAELKLPGDALTRFSEATLNGYAFDHEFTDVEKRAYLRTRPKTLPFADRLFVPDSDYIILGHETYEPPEPPVGDDETQFRAWNAALLARFIASKNVLFASLTSDRKFTISKMKIDGDKVVRHYEEKAKNYKPTVCGTGDNKKDVMTAFAKFVDKNGVGVPASIKTVADICVYAELLAREETNCIWVTPEELSVLYDNPTNEKAFRAKFKE